MPLPTLTPPSTLIMTTEPLSPASFSRFGTCITSPFSPSLHSMPSQPPSPLHPDHQPQPTLANQNSALRTAPISPMANNYPSLSIHPPSRPQMSMFSCFPRHLSDPSHFPIRILERHPFTTQTFCPLGLDPNDKSTLYLVIVAPSLSTPAEAHLVGSRSTADKGDTQPDVEIEVRSPPDLTNLSAFVAHGGQAVTYAPGTWHAPMVVLGQKRVDFVVSQFVNGVPEDDTQEVLVGEGIGVDLRALGLEGLKARL